MSRLNALTERLRATADGDATVLLCSVIGRERHPNFRSSARLH